MYPCHRVNLQSHCKPAVVNISCLVASRLLKKKKTASLVCHMMCAVIILTTQRMTGLEYNGLWLHTLT